MLSDYDNFDIRHIPFYKFKERKQAFNEYDKYQSLKLKLSEYKSKLAEISREISSEEFKRLVKEGKIVLTEEDKKVLDNHSDFKSLNDLCLVHKCNYMPFNNEIKSALSSGGESIRSFKIGIKSYDYKHKEQRHTVHFAVNGEVSSHDLGNWDVRKYAIIVPFECLLNNIVSACACDTFVRDKASLNEKCYILCPKEQVEIVQKSNNLANVIPYEGNNVSGFANAVVSFLGYKCEKITNHGWVSDDEYLYNALMRNKNLNILEHMSTEDYSDDLMKNSYNHILEIYSRLLMPDIEIDLNLFAIMQKDPYGDNVYSNLRFYLSEIIESTNNTTFSRNKTIILLIRLLKDLKSINPEFCFETNYDVLKSKYFENYYDSIAPFINAVLNALFKGIIDKSKKSNADYSEENSKDLHH